MENNKTETRAPDSINLEATSEPHEPIEVSQKRRRRARDGAKADAKQKTLFDAFRAGDG